MKAYDRNMFIWSILTLLNQSLIPELEANVIVVAI